MPKFMILFLEGAMDIPDEELDEVSRAAHVVVDDAREAGVWVFGGGLRHHEDAATVGLDGSVQEGRAIEDHVYLAGVAVVDVESRADALEWAKRLGAACRCAMEVREFLPVLRDQ
ncbi:YciI family protein [Aeromicrobium sp. 179-A 4D2 NHS]|uniref:YciI family protein n=1 Tax=Aeromicrobium sp. 179-A 4D2 NHS TaxID=3142375 RepID=UPI0039A0CFE5